MIQINIPIAQFEELSKLISCQSIAEKGIVKGISHVRGLDLVITGGVSEPHVDGWSILMAESVVPIGLYDGPTHRIRNKSYKGWVFYHGGRQYVFTGNKFEIYPVQINYQLQLF